METPSRHSKDGRRVIDPPCEFGHRLQAMECPSCPERLGRPPCPPEHWEWYRKRYAKKAR
jgi:hypothetical protein